MFVVIVMFCCYSILLIFHVLSPQSHDLVRELGAIGSDVMETWRDLLKPFKETTVVMSTESNLADSSTGETAHDGDR